MDHALIRARDEALTPMPGERYFADADPNQVVDSSFAEACNVKLASGETAGGFIVQEPGLYTIRAEVAFKDAYVTFRAGVLTGVVDEPNETFSAGGDLIIPPARKTAAAEYTLSLLPGDLIYPVYVPTKPARIGIGAVTLTRLGVYESSRDRVLHLGLRDTPYRSPWDIASACKAAKITRAKTVALFKALGLDPPTEVPIDEDP